MTFELFFTDQAQEQFDTLPAKKIEKVRKALGTLQANPRHPGLNTHVYHGLSNPFSPDAPVFEAYAENNTPGAYRIFWVYGPKRLQVTVVAITPHR